MRLNASVVPSLHHRKEGWMRHQEKCRAATESPQPGWFTSLSSIGKPEGKAVAKPPPPLRRNGVDSPHLPACIFHAPGDPAVIAPEEERYRDFLS